MRPNAFIKKHGSTILTTLGAVGVIGTAVSAVKETPKALYLLNEAKKEKGEDLTVIEKVKVAGPVYIPSVIIGTSTIACIIGSNILNKRHQAALLSAYTMLDQSYKEYKDKVIDLYGEEADEKIEEEISKGHVEPRRG